MFAKSKYYNALAKFNLGLYAEALPLFIGALTGNMGTIYQRIDAMRDVAICYYYANDNENALYWLNEALDAAKSVEKSREESQHLYEKMGIKAPIEIGGDVHPIYYWFAKVYLSIENYELALNYVNEALKRTDDPLSWNLKANILLQLGNTNAAESAARKAINLVSIDNQKDVDDFKTTLSDILATRELKKIIELQEKKEYNYAIDKCKKILELENLTDQNRIKIHNLLGDCYVSLKKYQLAISEYNASLSIDSESASAIEATMNLAMYYLMLGRLDDAKDMRNLVLSLIDNDSEYLSDLTTILDMLTLVAERKYDELLATYLNPSITNPDFAESSQIIICETFIKVKEFDKLIAYLSKMDENNDVLAGYQGIVYYQQKHYETSLQCLERSINAGNGDNADMWFYKGECHFQIREYDKAIDAYKKALETKEPFSGDNPFKNVFDESSLEERIRISKEKLAEIKSHTIPSHITINGNSAPISFGGIIATDDAVVNRSNTAEKSEVSMECNFCPQCGQKVDPGDLFCKKCGKKLT